MKRFIYSIGLLILLFSTTLASAQQAEQDKETEEEKEPEKTKLNLPDVVIYGQEKVVREAGKKLRANEEKPNLLDLDVDYQSSILKAAPAEEKLLMMSNEPELGSATSVTAQFGNFNTPLLHIIHAQELPKINYNIAARYHQSDGQFTNSEFTVANGRAHLGWNLRGNFNVMMDAHYFYKDYGLHGSAISDLTRQARYANGKLASQWNISENGTVDIQMDFANFELIQENSNNLKNLNESTMHVMAVYNQAIRKMQLRLGTKFWHNQTTNFSRDFDYFAFEAMLTYPVQRYLSVNPALTVERMSNYESRVSPGLEIVVTPVPQLGISAKANRSLEPYLVFDYWQQNQYLHTSDKQPVADVALNLEMNLEYQIVPNWSFHAGVNHKLISDDYYWRQDSLTRLFNIGQFNDASLTKLMIGLEAEIANFTAFRSYFIFYDGSIDDNLNTTVQKEIPYLAKYQIPVVVQFQFNRTTTLSVQSLWVGPRRTSVDTDRELDSYLLLSARFEKALFNYYSFYIGSDNLVDDEFIMWEDYPHTGLQFYLGINAKW